MYATTNIICFDPTVKLSLHIPYLDRGMSQWFPYINVLNGFSQVDELTVAMASAAAREIPPGGLLLSQLMRDSAKCEADDRDIVVHGNLLRVSNPSLGSAGCARVLRVVQNNDQITAIDLTGCNINRGDELAEAIQSCQHLKRLMLEGNDLGLARTGITSLASAIALNSTLQEVDLRSNRIGPSFAAALANALRSSRSLTFLDLRWNTIGPSGAAAFISLLQKNPVITGIQLAGNGIPQKLLSQIDKLIEDNRAGMVLPQCRSHVKHPMEEDSKTLNREGMEAIYSGRVAALEEEINTFKTHVESLKKEKDDLNLEVLATQNQLKAVRLELTEEALLRKYVEKEAGNLKEQLLTSKQELACCQERLAHDAKVANATLATQNAALAEAEKREKISQELHMVAVSECNSSKEQILRIRNEHSVQLQLVEDTAKADAESSISTIKRLEFEIIASKQAHTEEITKIRAQSTADLKRIETEKEAAVREIDRMKTSLLAAEAQFAVKEKGLQQEKEAIEQVLNARLAAVKTEVESMHAELDNMHRELAKVKRKHATEIEEYETALAQQKAMQHRTELSKSDLEDKIFALTAEKVQLQEKLKLADDREKLLEKKMELERLKQSEQASAEEFRRLDEKRRLENELQTTRRLIDNTQKHLQEIQAEQGRRKQDVEKRVMGVESAFIEWIREQFASLRAANATQPLLVGEF